MNLAPYHDFAVFPDCNWETFTDQPLRPPVSDLRKKFLDRTEFLFEKFRDQAFSSIHRPQARGRESQKLELFIDSLQTGLATIAVQCAEEFQKVAAANANSIDGDRLDWAYAQVHNVLSEFLNIPSSPNAEPHAESLPKGHRLRIFLRTVCDGEKNKSDDFIKAMEGAASHSSEWTKFIFEPEWRSPEWVKAYLRGEQYERTDGWRRLNEELTHAVLERFVRDFWLELEHRFDESMRSLRISLAQQEVLTNDRTTKAVASRRRVSQAAERFDAEAGRLMYEAHQELRKQGQRPSRHRTTANLPSEVFLGIVKQMDAENSKSEPQFPLAQVLSQAIWGRISQYNKKNSRTKKGAIKTWEKAARHPEFRTAIHQKFNRAEAFYLRLVVQQKSQTSFLSPQ